MDLYVGLDLGTTGMKAVLADENMHIAAFAKADAPMTEDGLFRTFDADDFCDRVFDLIKNVTAGADPEDIKALCAASASGNTLFLDEEDRPMGTAISWTDRRILGREDEYLPGFDFGGVHEMTGWPYIGMFPLTHIAWMKKERPDVFAKCKRICMSTEYLLFRLCGKWGIDPSTATPSYLLDQKKGAYCPEYLEYFGLGEEMLPPLYPSETVLGALAEEASGLTGLRPGTKIVLGSFDHPACARGMGAARAGDLLISCGTSWVGLFVCEGRESAIRAGLLIDPYLIEKGRWAGMFAMTRYGEKIDAAVRELIDRSDERFDILCALAQKKKDVKKNLSLNEFDINTWTGMSREETARAIMKAACSDLKSGLDELGRQGFVPGRVFMAGGPASCGVWPKIMADTLNKEVACLHGRFGGAAGAALTAAAGDGKFRNEADFFEGQRDKYSVYFPEDEND